MSEDNTGGKLDPVQEKEVVYTVPATPVSVVPKVSKTTAGRDVVSIMNAADHVTHRGEPYAVDTGWETKTLSQKETETIELLNLQGDTMHCPFPPALPPGWWKGKVQ